MKDGNEAGGCRDDRRLFLFLGGQRGGKATLQREEEDGLAMIASMEDKQVLRDVDLNVGSIVCFFSPFRRRIRQTRRCEA